MTQTFELGPKQKLWITALRSGEFQQGKDVLRSADNNFCCLGVACQVLGRQWSSNVNYEGGYVCEGVHAVAPDSVMHELRLRTNSGTHAAPFSRGARTMCLAEMNDAGKSFSTIADILENEPSAYFTGAA